MSVINAVGQLMAAGGYDPDVLDWLMRVDANGGTVSLSTAIAVNTFVVETKAAGVWSQLDRINLFCGDFLAALVPLKVGGGFAVEQNFNFEAADYQESGVDRGGFKGNYSNKYFNTGFNPSVSLAADSSHMGMYITSLPLATREWRVPLGAYGAGGYNFDGNWSGGYRIRGIIGGKEWSFAENQGAGGMLGHLITVADGVSSIKGYFGGNLFGNVHWLEGSKALPNKTVSIFGSNDSPPLPNRFPTDCSLGAYHFGGVLSAPQALALSNALRKFMQAMDRWVHPAVGDWERRARHAGNATPWDASILKVLSNFMVSLDSANLTPKIGRVNLFAGNSIPQTRVPLLYGAPFYFHGNITSATVDNIIGHTAGEYSLTNGWEKTAPGNCIQVNASLIPQLVGGIAVWVKEVPLPGAALMGWADALHPAETEAWRIDTIAGNIGGSYGGDIVADAVSFATPVAGFFHLIRTAADDLRLFNNGMQVASNTNASVATATPSPPFIEAQNVGGVADADVDNTVRTAGYSIESAALTPAEALLYYDVWYGAQFVLGRL
jgi:hypothetical protein